MDRVELAKEYLAAGLSLVPIKLDGSKSPWDRSWKHLMTHRLDPAEADVIFADFGIGIIGGAVSGNLEIIDCDNEAIGRDFLRLLEAMAPEILEKLTIIKTPRPGLHLYYRCEGPVTGNVGLAFESQKVKLIEKKSEGGYVLAPGNPPEAHPTGRTYEQIYGPPLTELESLTEAEREALLTWARSLSRWVQEAPTPPAYVPRSDADRDRVQEFCERATWQWILESAGWTHYRSTSDKTYWTRPGKTTGVSASTGLQSSDLRDLMRVFSSSTPFDTSRCYNKFAAYAILHHGNDWGAAIKQAIELRLIADLPQQTQDYGVNLDQIMAAGLGDGANVLTPVPRIELPSIPDEDEDLSPDELEEYGDVPKPFPAELFDTPGFIGDVIRYNLETAYRPQPVLAFAGALALMSALTGRTIRDEANTRTNIFVLSTAVTGGGKEHARRVNNQILAKALGERLIESDNLASDAALASLLKRQPVSLIQMDEFGRVVASMASSSRSPWLSGIMTELLKIYGLSSGIYIGKTHANANHDVKAIPQPHLVLNCTTTPDTLWPYLTLDSVKDGFLSRFLVFEPDPDKTLPKINYAVQAKEPPESIIGLAKLWLEYHNAVITDNNLEANKKTVEYSSEAYERLMEHGRKIDEHKDRAIASRSAIWVRVFERTRKLALIFAASRAWQPDDDFKIELEDLNRAIACSNWCARLMCSRVLGDIHADDFGKHVMQVLACVARKSPISKARLARSVRMRKKIRDEVISDLLDRKLIKMELIKTATNTEARFIVTPAGTRYLKSTRQTA